MIFDSPETTALKQQNTHHEAELAMQKETTAMQVGEALSDETILAMQKERETLTKWTQDLDDELRELVADLRSEQMDLETGTYRRRTMFVGYNKEDKEVYEQVPQLMNEIGINWVLSYVRTLISRNLMNSNLSETFIYDKLKSHGSKIRFTMIANIELYQIKFENLDSIKSTLMSYIEATYFRAMDDGERAHQRSITKISDIRTQNNQQQPEKKTLFGIPT